MEEESMARKKPTPDDDIRSRFALTDRQTAALAALADGESVTAAAKRAGVSRQTVSEWKNRNPAFIAAFNGCTRDQMSQVHGRLVQLGPRAVEVLAGELDAGGDGATKAARDVLHLIQKLGPALIGSADPRVVEKEIEAGADEAFWSALFRLTDDRDDV